jgi:hypothetical protein
MKLNTLHGSCLCGDIRYEIEGLVEPAENCHCGMCRKAHGAAFSTNAVVQSADLNVVSGANLLTEYESSSGRRKCFCSRCGSQMFIRRLGRPEITVITLGSLDDAPPAKPTRHVFTASKAPWYEIDEELPQFDVYPAQ